jgi:hypothetical protein
MSKISAVIARTHGRLLILLVFLPLLCFLPWILLTGPSDYGRKLGILSDFSIQSLIDPASLAAAAKRAASEPRADEKASETAGKLDMLLTREAAGRLMSVAATAMLILVATVSGAYGWITAWQLAAEPRDRRWLWLAAAIAVVLIAMTWPVGDHRVYDLLGVDAFKSTIGKIHGRRSLDVLDWQQLINNIVLVVAGVGLSFAAAYIAVWSTRLHRTADHEAYVDLKRKLDRILLASALMLAAGVIDLRQWTALPIPFIADPTLAAAYGSFTAGFVALQSLCYVAGLVAMFVPPAWLLDNARERIAHDVVPEAAPVPAPASGFAVTDLLRVAAMLAPVLVGPISNFVSLKIGM